MRGINNVEKHFVDTCGKIYAFYICDIRWIFVSKIFETFDTPNSACCVRKANSCRILSRLR